MAEYTEDPLGWPLMVALSACLCTTIAERNLPTPCFCGPVPGPAAVMDYCGTCGGKVKDCGGQAWVRLVTEFPSVDFPQPVVIARCEAPMAMTFEVGISRCLPVGSANSINGFTPPSLEQQMEAARLQLADKAAAQRAIQCCMNRGEYRDLTYTLGAYTPLQVSGDCGGGFWQVTVWAA